MRYFLSVALVGVALCIPTAARCGILISDFDGGGVTPGQIFEDPSFSGSTDSNIAAGDSTGVSTDMAYSGTQSLKVNFSFASTDATLWDRLTTSPTNPVIDATQALTMKVFVASQDPLGVSLGIRERTYGSDPAIGSTGSGTSRGIEFIGSAGNTGSAPNPTHWITPGSWQDLTFFLPYEPLGTLTGNSILEPSFGKVDLEDLAIRSNGNTNPITFYIDDIRVVNTSDVPEPGSMALLATGLIPLLGLRRKTR
jgi:hypothetical protein